MPRTRRSVPAPAVSSGLPALNGGQRAAEFLRIAYLRTDDRNAQTAFLNALADTCRTDKSFCDVHVMDVILSDLLDMDFDKWLNVYYNNREPKLACLGAMVEGRDDLAQTAFDKIHPLLKVKWGAKDRRTDHSEYDIGARRRAALNILPVIAKAYPCLATNDLVILVTKSALRDVNNNVHVSGEAQETLGQLLPLFQGRLEDEQVALDERLAELLTEEAEDIDDFGYQKHYISTLKVVTPHRKAVAAALFEDVLYRATEPAVAKKKHGSRDDMREALDTIEIIITHHSDLATPMAALKIGTVGPWVATQENGKWLAETAEKVLKKFRAVEAIAAAAGSPADVLAGITGLLRQRADKTFADRGLEGKLIEHKK